MRNTIHIAVSYLNYYKKQTASLLLSVILFSALLTGMGGLLGSGKNAALTNARQMYGDWHYSMRGDMPWAEALKQNPGDGAGYEIEKTGWETVRKMIEEPYPIQFVHADRGYLDMMNRNLKKGYYPKKRNEIAMDSHTLQNLGIPEKLGSRVTLDHETFILCGIFTDMPEKLSELQGDFMQVFVNDTLDYGKNGVFVYLKFNEKRDVYRQAERFCNRFGAMEDMTRNNGISAYVGSESPGTVWETIKRGISDKAAGLPYIWGTLNYTGNLTEHAILISIALFGAFILYSLFQISVTRRISQYSVMQTIGMTDRKTFDILFCELGLVSAVGYPVGCMTGNGIAWLLYGKIGQIFIVQERAHMGSEPGETASAYAAANLPGTGVYQINWSTVAGGALFLLLVIVLISALLIRRMKKLTLRQMLATDLKKRLNRKIYSLKRGNMTGILTRKFMFSRKGAFLSMLLSLSIGSILFLGAFYVTENTQIHNELTYKADDGLGSDIQVYEQSDQLTDVIPETSAEQMRQVAGVGAFHPVRYLPGEIALNDGKLIWTSYFAETANDESFQPDPVLMEKYNGLAVQTGRDDYALKVNIYGYDDEMLEELNDYLLGGEINPDQMRKDNSVIFKTLMGGQGDYTGIKIRTGDEVELKTIKDRKVPQEALKFLGARDWYQNRTMKVAALTSRPLAKVKTYIGDEYSSVVDIIMTNEQMEQNFGARDYQTISISLKQGSDPGMVSRQLSGIAKGIDQCTVKDYSQQIQAQNLYLAQKMLFFYGIALILFGTSLLQIMNSMQYLIMARKREFGILRAMGITDAGFRKMLAKEGLRYGICSCLTVLILYIPVQRILHYFMIHVYLYLHPKSFISWEILAGVLLLNLAFCVGMVLISGRSILRKQIIEEIRE